VRPIAPRFSETAPRHFAARTLNADGHSGGAIENSIAFRPRRHLIERTIEI
jgi:hypothetical protein